MTKLALFNFKNENYLHCRSNSLVNVNFTSIFYKLKTIIFTNKRLKAIFLLNFSTVTDFCEQTMWIETKLNREPGCRAINSTNKHFDNHFNRRKLPVIFTSKKFSKGNANKFLFLIMGKVYFSLPFARTRTHTHSVLSGLQIFILDGQSLKNVCFTANKV